MNPYALRCGPWVIGKFMVQGEARYLLTHDNGGPARLFDMAQGAMDAAAQDETEQGVA